MVKELDSVLAALADPARRKVVWLLRTGPKRAGELAASVELSPPAMSRHLRVLRKSGLVEAGSDEDDARVRLYALRAEPFVGLQAWLDQIGAFWTDQLGSFRSHTGRTRSKTQSRRRGRI